MHKQLEIIKNESSPKILKNILLNKKLKNLLACIKIACYCSQ